MKISQKLFFGYLAIAFIMSIAGYLTISIYIEIKNKVVELKANTLEVAGSSEKLVRALESSQKSLQALIDKKPKIIYTYSLTSSEMRQASESQEQIEQQLRKDLEKIERLISPLIEMIGQEERLAATKGLPDKKDELKALLEFKKKHFHYHYRYLSHFITLADEKPDQAMAFFRQTLEPHYRENIYPLIQRYRESEKEEREKQIGKIINEFIPNASIVIILSTTVTLISIFGLGYYVARSVSKPLRLLTEAALQIGQGQLNTRINIHTRDEVGILADAFNRMTADLSRTTVSKTYVDNIIESMLESLIVVDPDGRIRTVNQATLDLIGYSEQGLLGKPISDVLIEKELVASTIDLLRNKGSLQNLETTLLTKAEERIAVRISGAVMRGNLSEIEGIVYVAQDIREHKRSELALQKAYAEMERRVNERTAELLAANRLLKKEIAKHRRTETALRESEHRLRRLSSHIITAQEKERRRISMELHDDLGQSLSLLKVQLSSIQNRLNGKAKVISGDLQETRQYLDLVIESVRRLSKDLSPTLLEDLGFTAAIQWLINDFERYCQFEIVREIETIDAFFSLEKQIILYRVFQEIMSNIAKHSGASRVMVRIEPTEKSIIVQVDDNGCGFNLKQLSALNAAERGMGLAAMQERVLMLGTDIDITTREGAGTRIGFVIPLGEENTV